MSLLVFDGWSAGALNRDLLAFLADWNAGLPPLEIDFGDYVTALEGLQSSDAWLADGTGGGPGWTPSRTRPRSRWWPTRTTWRPW